MRSRWLVVIVALIAAFAFALSVQGGRWWSLGPAEVGPFGTKQCIDDSCTPTGLGWLGDRYARIGMATWAAGLIATLVFVALAACVATRRVPRLLAKLAIVTLATATLAGLAFIVAFPMSGASFDRGALLFGLAVLLGATAAVAAWRVSSPASSG